MSWTSDMWVNPLYIYFDHRDVVTNVIFYSQVYLNSSDNMYTRYSEPKLGWFSLHKPNQWSIQYTLQV